MDQQPNWKKVLKADPTDWLLEPDEPGPRYLALRDIVDVDEKEIQVARRKAHRQGPITRILDKMNPEGYWVNPGPGYRAKYRSTVWSIISLAQLGASVEEDERIATACAYLLDNTLAKGGQFSGSGIPSHTWTCLQGNLLTSLLDMGFKDGRLDVAFEWMARTVTGEDLPREITDEGLIAAKHDSIPVRELNNITGPRFVCRMNKNLSCAWGGTKVMMAFSRLSVERRSGLIERAIKAGVEFFFSVDPSTAGYPCGNGREPDIKWWKFHFPVFYATDILQVAEALTTLGYGADPGLANTLDLIKGKQDESGRWLLEFDYRSRMWLNYGSRGKPNKWVTLRALRVLKRAAQQKLE